MVGHSPATRQHWQNFEAYFGGNKNHARSLEQRIFNK
jgi:hypothetical protein